MTDLDGLLERAQAALDAGNPLVARGYWRRATRVAPERLDVWTKLCQVTEAPAERIRCLEHIVELDPANDAALEELTDLREAQEEGHDDQPAPALPVPVDAPAAASAGDPAHVHVGAGRQDITPEMRHQWDEALAAGKPLVCINHPQTETGLRCNQCSAPICTRCAVHTPVGFRCKECIKEQQSTFFTARWADYPLAAVVALALSVPAAVLAGLAGWWFALIISPVAGGLVGGVVHRAVGRRRGRWTWLVVAVSVVLGALVALAFAPYRFISIIVYAVLATSSAVGILRLGRSRQ